MAAVRPGVIKPLRWPRFWLGAWLVAVLGLIVVCLVPLQGLPPMPDNSDKVEHLLGYFVLAASAVQLFKRASLPWVAAGLVLLGIGIEIAQGQTVYRSADPYDALFNALGVALGMATALTPWRDLLLRIEKRSQP